MTASGSLNPAGCDDKVHYDLCGRQRRDPVTLAMKRIEKTIQYSSCFPIHEGFMTNRTNVGRNITDCDPYQRTPPFEGLQSVSRLCCARTFARTSCFIAFSFSDSSENPLLGGVARSAGVGPFTSSKPTPGPDGPCPSREGNRSTLICCDMNFHASWLQSNHFRGILAQCG